MLHGTCVAVKKEAWVLNGRNVGLLLTRTVFDTIPITRYSFAVFFCIIVCPMQCIALERV